MLHLVLDLPTFGSRLHPSMPGLPGASPLPLLAPQHPGQFLALEIPCVIPETPPLMPQAESCA